MSTKDISLGKVANGQTAVWFSGRRSGGKTNVRVCDSNSPDGGQLSQRRVVLVEGLFSFPCREANTPRHERYERAALPLPPPHIPTSKADAQP